jgi:hypothetical protein
MNLALRATLQGGISAAEELLGLRNPVEDSAAAVHARAFASRILRLVRRCIHHAGICRHRTRTGCPHRFAAAVRGTQPPSRLRTRHLDARRAGTLPITDHRRAGKAGAAPRNESALRVDCGLAASVYWAVAS